MFSFGKRILGVVLAAIISLAAAYFGTKANYEKTGKLTSPFDYLDKPSLLATVNTQQSTINSKKDDKPKEAAKTYLIEQVPFTPQAPHAVWDAVHKEACEEASALMAARYFKGGRSGLIGADNAEAEIQQLVAWQKEKFGYFEDTDVAQTAQILREYYGIDQVAVRYDISIEDILNEVGKGKLVIVPAAGRRLGNPFYTPPGPLYHMLVVIGYTRDQVITNDPGTRRGLGFRFNQDVFFNAVHDWTGNKDTIETGRKAMIVVG